MGSNGNGYYSLIILALPVLLVIWMFWSGNRRQKQLREFNSSLNVGDAVITSSGLYGTIKHLDAESAYLVVAEGTTVRFDRRAIAMKQSDAQSGIAAGAPAEEQ
ncbi:MAG TPA: preprotein translocase subunit YajC [Dermatophilaceae bacterium]|nr:preprotein translocase subunit YajC [Dermatophilaceae bacterium]